MFNTKKSQPKSRNQKIRNQNVATKKVAIHLVTTAIHHQTKPNQKKKKMNEFGCLNGFENSEILLPGLYKRKIRKSLARQVV